MSILLSRACDSTPFISLNKQSVHLRQSRNHSFCLLILYSPKHTLLINSSPSLILTNFFQCKYASVSFYPSTNGSVILSYEDESRRRRSKEPYYFKNTMIMKGNTEWENERIDLPSLTSLTGDMYTLMSIGSITLESTSLWIDWFRYPAVVIWRYPSRSWLLLLYLFASFVKCVWLLSFISRCWWSRVFHHKQMVEGISLVFILSAPVCLFPVTLWVFLPMILKVLVSNYWFQKAYFHQRAPQEPLYSLVIVSRDDEGKSGEAGR